MRCLQLPLFWFVSFTNGIKRKKDKTFCFDVQLRPNQCTWQTCIHEARCKTQKLCGIRLSKVPRLLLEKRVTTCSQYKSLVCRLLNKRWLTHYPKVTKKEKQTWPTSSNINPTNKVLLWARQRTYLGVSICRSCLKLLLVAFASRWLLPLS